MKLKNGGFIQLHIEKIVLAVGILFLLIAIGVVVFGMVLKPYQVELSGRAYDEPADVIPVMVKEAEGLTSRLPDSGREIPASIPEDYVVPDLSTNYEQMLDQPLQVTEQVVSVARDGMSQSHIEGEIPPPPVYHLPTPAMVTDTLMKHGFAVLDDSDLGVITDYEAIWGDGQRDPADFSYVFIEGEFDMAQWIETLEGEGSTQNMVPPGIWGKSLGLATVYLLREERDSVTGQWGNPTNVQLLPDYFGIAPDQEMPEDASTAQRWIDYLLAGQLNIAMVEPPLLSDGEEMLSPQDDPMVIFDAEAFEAMEEAERARLRAERRAQQEADRARRAAERENDRNRGNDGPGLGPGEMGPGGRGGSRGGPGGSSRGNDRSTTDRTTQRPTNPRETQDPLGPGRLGPGSIIPGNLGPGRPGVNGNDEDHLPEEGKIRVWAIDVTAQPGTTYRYKLIAGVINPLYGVDRLDEAQRSENRNRAALLPSAEDIDAAPWVGPIELESDSRFFVVSASDRGARVNIWRIYDGERVNEVFDVSPGDIIGGINDDGVNMQVGATVVDIDRRRDIDGKTIWVLIYIDPEGNLHERVLDQDKKASDQFSRDLRAQAQAEERAREMMEGPEGQGNNPGRPGELNPGLGPDRLGPGGLEPGEPGRTRR